MYTSIVKSAALPQRKVSDSQGTDTLQTGKSLQTATQGTRVQQSISNNTYSLRQQLRVSLGPAIIFGSALAWLPAFRLKVLSVRHLL